MKKVIAQFIQWRLRLLADWIYKRWVAPMSKEEFDKMYEEVADRL